PDASLSRPEVRGLTLRVGRVASARQLAPARMAAKFLFPRAADWRIMSIKGDLDHVDDSEPGAAHVQRTDTPRVVAGGRGRSVRTDPTEGLGGGIPGAGSAPAAGPREIGPVPVPLWRAEPAGDVRPEARCAGRHSRPLSAHRLAHPGTAHLRAPAPSGPGV